MIIVFCFFCFKQKTAYEMRISDWSSDVCSSDLGRVPAGSSIRHHLLDVLLRLSSSAAAGWRFEAARCGRKAQNGGKPSPGRLEIGRASCRERVCQYVELSVVAVSLTKKQQRSVANDNPDSTDTNSTPQQPASQREPK